MLAVARDLGKAIDRLQNRRGWLKRCMQAMAVNAVQGTAVAENSPFEANTAYGVGWSGLGIWNMTPIIHWSIYPTVNR